MECFGESEVIAFYDANKLRHYCEKKWKFVHSRLLMNKIKVKYDATTLKDAKTYHMNWVANLPLGYSSTDVGVPTDIKT